MVGGAGGGGGWGGGCWGGGGRRGRSPSPPPSPRPPPKGRGAAAAKKRQLNSSERCISTPGPRPWRGPGDAKAYIAPLGRHPKGDKDIRVSTASKFHPGPTRLRQKDGHSIGPTQGPFASCGMLGMLR